MNIELGKQYLTKDGELVNVTKDKWGKGFIAYTEFDSWYVDDKGVCDWDSGHTLIEVYNDY